MLAKTPKPPYYAVIFTSIRNANENDYDETAAKMAELSAARTGFLGMEHAASDGLSITVCYWESREAIAACREYVEHKLSQAYG